MGRPGSGSWERVMKVPRSRALLVDGFGDRERRRADGRAAVAVGQQSARPAASEHHRGRVIPAPRDHPRPVAPSINTYPANAPRLLKETPISGENRDGAGLRL